jgi:hypothetical protein
MNRKWALLTGIPVFLGLLVLSVLHYKERTVILDMAYHLFHILKDGTFAIQINRFGAALTQIFPVVASKAGLSLQAVALWYSVAFVLFYFLCFLIILLGLRNTRMAVVLLLFHTVMVTHSFYWIQCELIQGVSFSLVYLALVENELRRPKTSFLFQALSPAFLVTIVFFYPLLIFVLLFALIYFYLYYRERKDLLGGTAIAYLALFCIKIVFFSTGYDTEAMLGAKNIMRLFPDYFSIQSHKNFIRCCIRDYHMLIILLLVNIIVYLRTRAYGKLALLLVFFFGLLFLINVSYAQGAEQFYLEPQYMILALFVSFGLVYDVFPLMKEKATAAVVAVVALLAFFRIAHAHSFYSERVDWFRSYLKETRADTHRKIVLPQQFVPMDKLRMSWGSAYEFWLLSTMEQGESRSVIIEEQPGSLDWLLDNNKAFIAKWGVFDYNTLDKRYFRFTDTSNYIRK